jgi:hypothetical protein
MLVHFANSHTKEPSTDRNTSVGAYRRKVAAAVHNHTAVAGEDRREQEPRALEMLQGARYNCGRELEPELEGLVRTQEQEPDHKQEQEPDHKQELELVRTQEQEEPDHTQEQEEPVHRQEQTGLVHA